MYIYLEFTFVLDWIFRASFRICCCYCFLTVWFMIQRRHSIRLKPVLWVRYWRFLCHNTTRNPFGSKGLNHLPLLPFTCYGKRENTTKQNQKTKKWKRDFVSNSCFMQEQRDRERERCGLFSYCLVFCPFICLAKTNSPAILCKSHEINGRNRQPQNPFFFTQIPTWVDQTFWNNPFFQFQQKFNNAP